MTANCDEVFQQIQELQQQRQALVESKNTLASQEPPEEPDAAQRFVFKDRETGQPIEVDFNQLTGYLRGLDDVSKQNLIAQAIGERAKPVGSEGQFQNFGQLIDRIGIDGARDAGLLVEVLTGAWKQANPADFASVVSVNNSAEFAQRLANSYAEAGIRLEADTLAQGIVRDAAPFLSILDRQTRLQVFSQVANDNLIKSIDAIREAISETQLPPGLSQMQAFNKTAAMAIFANRSAALSRRVSGKLLQQLQNNAGSAPAIAGKTFSDEVMRSANETFGDQAQLVGEGSVMGRVQEAAGRGVDGLKDLDAIRESVARDGADPGARLDKDFEQTWRRNARAYYKDSQLFNINSQVVASYLSNKMVYVGEGYRQVFQNAQKLRPPIKSSGFSKLAMQMMPGNVIDGLQTAWHSSLLANDVIRDSWKQALGDDAAPGLLGSWQAAVKNARDGKAAFGDAADERGGKTMTIDEQYAAARQVLYGDSGVPASGDKSPGWSLDKFNSSLKALKDEEPYLIPLAIRDKFFLSAKLLGNHIIENTVKASTGKQVRIPVTPALQLLGAVDERSGLRAYMTIRANDLLLQNLQDPALRGLDWNERKAMVRQELEDQLYQATPSKQNIADYREQFDLDGTVSDDEIATRIAAEKVGSPILKDDGQKAAYEKAEEMRMLKKPDGWLGAIDDGIMKARENPYVDAFLPYWRAPMSSGLWELKFAMPPITETANMLFGATKFSSKATAPTDEQIAKVTAAWYAWLGLTGSFMALNSMGAIEGSISSDPRLKAQGKAAGKVPNSVGGIPGLQAVPILKTLFMYKDLVDVFDQAEVSEFDRKNAFMGLFQVFAGQVLRETGFKQFNELYSAVTSQDPKQWNRFFGFMIGGQINPASGLLRQVERIGGRQSTDLLPPRYGTPDDVYLRQQSGVSQPWHGIQEKLTGLIFSMAPSLSGQPVRETDYLGRKLRRFDGIFRGEWPVGMPGHFDSPVHSELERLQMLQPPTPLMDGRLKGLPMTKELEVEFNNALAKPSPIPMSENPLFVNRMRWRPPGAKSSVDLVDMLDRLTTGKTQYEALNGLFQSQSWKSWEADPDQTTNPRISDVPRAQMVNRIGPRVVKLISDYYSEQASETIMKSSSQAALEWQRLWAAKQAGLDPDAGEAMVERVEMMTR